MVILYTRHCPKCTILEKKLLEHNIEYETCTDVDLMLEKRFTDVPMLQVDDIIYDFNGAINWLKSQ